MKRFRDLVIETKVKRAQLTELPGDHEYARELVAGAAEAWVKTHKQPVSIPRGSPQR